MPDPRIHTPGPVTEIEMKYCSYYIAGHSTAGYHGHTVRSVAVRDAQFKHYYMARQWMSDVMLTFLDL